MKFKAVVKGEDIDRARYALVTRIPRAHDISVHHIGRTDVTFEADAPEPILPLQSWFNADIGHDAQLTGSLLWFRVYDKEPLTRSAPCRAWRAADHRPECYSDYEVGCMCGLDS